MDKNTLLNISKNMQDLTFVLANKNYNKIGALSNVDQNTVVYKKTMHGLELSFEVYKELNGIKEKLWDDITDFKLVWLKETDEYFQICVSTDELSYTKKTVTATSLCEAELSQVNLYGVEINTEDDIARDDYKVTTFYDMDNPEASIINRIFSKVPQYTIKHVDASLSKIQRSFSVDGTSILDFLNGDCAEQFNCLFTFDSTDRSVSIYDLYTVCEDCGERNDMSNFTHIDENGSLTYTCPKCGSHNVKYYGEDTKIFVDNENLTDEVQLETNTDSVKNCFKLIAGDDLMTATVRLLNMNGSDYIYYISDEQKKDMPKELVNKIESYDELCASYNTEYESLVSQIYEASSKLYYYKNTMMPTIEQSTVTAATEAAKLTSQNLSPLGLSSVSTSTSKSTVESALKNYAKVYVKSGYVKLEINDSSYTYKGLDSTGYHYGTWTGNFKVTNYSDEDDIAYSPTITVYVYDNYKDFIDQKIKKTILDDADDDDSIFDVLNIDNLDNFKEALTYYCLNRLKSFYDAIQSALDVLVQMNQGVQDAIAYDSLYVPYYNKLQACQVEIDKRQVTVDEWQTKYDNTVSRQQEIQKILNFEDYIGKDLYKLFCCYRREDTYQNDNYISDGLEDQEVIERAKEFLEVAKKELVKSSTMQHSISTTLYNLLLISEFKPILNSFEVGNWIRVRVDGNIYKLRLIDYEISFSSMNTINVNFSDVTKIHDSVSDVEGILKSAQNMSSSYSYISKQADAGHKASIDMDRIVEDGLNSALVNIKNNDREEITYDKHGILCREYDDISDDYSDEQLIITHNILGYTDNGMKSVKASLGKHEYTYFDGNAFVKDIAYGLSCEFVQSGYIYGSQIISGDIYSSNYSPSAGTHINLKEGSFSFAGGKFSYDPNKDKMIMRGVTIEWSTSTPPEIADIDGLTEQLDGIDDQLDGINDQLKGIDEYLDQLDGRIQSFSQTTDPSTDWATTELKNNHIGDLWFNPNNGLTKRWTGTSWETITDSILESLAKSKAQVFTAKPTVAYFKGDMLIPVETFTVSGVTYKQEKAYRALKDSNGTTFSNSDWDALDYTNDDAVNAFINGDYADDVKEIQKQIDGKSRAWYQSTDPSITWDTSEDHEGDLWYNTSATSQVTYIYKNGVWKETNVPKAVFDTIDGKRQIFVKKPTSSYMTGDLWIISELDCTNGKITVNGVTYNANSTLIAILPSGVTERTTFTASDWTDISTQDGIVALDQSTQALSKFDDIANDGKITPTEKQQIKSLFENITANKTQTDSQCSQYGINSSSSFYYSDYTNFNTAFTTLKNLINNNILNDMTTTINVPSNYNSVLSDYYSKQNTIIADIEKASKGYAESVLSNFVNGAYKTALENINTQIDGKADTFYQNTKPHAEYTNIASNSTYDLYVGDLWYDTSTGKSYMYNKVANGSNYNYVWQQMDVPEEVYDKIDGIASIYINIPSNPNVGDLLIPTSDITSVGKTYKAKKVYRYDGSLWNEINYTDDTALDIYKIEMNDFKQKVNQALTGNATTEIGTDYVISPKIGAQYLYVSNDNYSVEIDPNHGAGNNTLDGYLFCIRNKSDDSKILSVDTSGNGYFSGTISGSRIEGSSGNFTEAFSVNVFDADTFRTSNIIAGSFGTIISSSNNSDPSKQLNSQIVALDGDVIISGSNNVQLEGRQGIILTSYENGNGINVMPGYGSKFCYRGIEVATISDVLTYSDQRVKHSIQKLKDISDIYMGFEPVSFYYNISDEYTSGENYGLIAQDLEELLSKHGEGNNGIIKKLSPSEKDKRLNGIYDKVYKIDYNQFHALHIRMIQKHQREIDALTQQNISLEGRIAILEQMVSQLSSQLNQTN